MSVDRVHFSRKTLLILLVLMLIIGVAVWATWYVSQSSVRNEADTAAAVALVDSEETPYVLLDGTPFSFADIRGQVRVVTSWASWVPASREELPVLNAIAEAYMDESVVFLAINRKEPQRRIEAFLQQLPELGSITIVIDETDAYYKAAEGYAMPETRIYDTSGNVVFVKRGPVTQAEIEAALDEVVSE